MITGITFESYACRMVLQIGIDIVADETYIGRESEKTDSLTVGFVATGEVVGKCEDSFWSDLTDVSITSCPNRK